MQLFQFVEETCISTDSSQAACEIAYHELSFAHKISSQTIPARSKQSLETYVDQSCLHIQKLSKQ